MGRAADAAERRRQLGQPRYAGLAQDAAWAPAPGALHGKQKVYGLFAELGQHSMDGRHLHLAAQPSLCRRHFHPSRIDRSPANAKGGRSSREKNPTSSASGPAFNVPPTSRAAKAATMTGWAPLGEQPYQPLYLNCQSGLLQYLPRCRFLNHFAAVHVAAGHAPKADARLVPSLHHEYFRVPFHDADCRYLGVVVYDPPARRAYWPLAVGHLPDF